MELLPMHEHEDLKSDCIDILNKEWPRSRGARLHSLSKSCDALPVALVLVQMSVNDNVAQRTVIGFSKLVDVQGHLNSCLIESVIVREEDRGKGYGRTLMELTEQRAQRLGIKTAYLNTTDKVGFYSRLGYVQCKPVISLGANAHRVPDSMLKHFTQNTDKGTQDLCNRMVKLETKAKTCPQQSPSLKNQLNNQTESPLSPSVNADGPNLKNLSTDATSFVKTQPQPLPTPPLLPPPPPPPVCKPSTTIDRLDPNQVTWMKKEL